MLIPNVESSQTVYNLT